MKRTTKNFESTTPAVSIWVQREKARLQNGNSTNCDLLHRRRPGMKNVQGQIRKVVNDDKIPWLKKIIWVTGVLRRTVVSDWRFDNLCGSHLQSQVVVLVSWKFKNPGERFDWSVDRVAVGKCVVWLAVKTCAEIGYANRWDVKWVINKVLLVSIE